MLQHPQLHIKRMPIPPSHVQKMHVQHGMCWHNEMDNTRTSGIGIGKILVS